MVHVTQRKQVVKKSVRWLSIRCIRTACCDEFRTSWTIVPSVGMTVG